MTTSQTPPTVILIDEPAPHVRRITLNRPEKRNALNHPLRGAILRALLDGDRDPNVRVQIVRGAGPSFSAGYDLGGGNVGFRGLDLRFGGANVFRSRTRLHEAKLGLCG